MANIVGFVGIGLSALVIALACASLSSKYWQTVELAGGVAKLNMGLWDYCLEVSGTKTCTKIKDESSSNYVHLYNFKMNANDIKHVISKHNHVSLFIF
jgi:hypothetical protein